MHPRKYVPLFEYTTKRGVKIAPEDIPIGTPIIFPDGTDEGKFIGYVGRDGKGIPKMGDKRPDGKKFHGGILYTDPETGENILVTHKRHGRRRELSFSPSGRRRSVRLKRRRSPFHKRPRSPPPASRLTLS